MWRESARLLKVGGRLTIVEWLNKATPMGPSLDKKVKKEYIIEIAKKFSLELEEDFQAGKFHYGLVFIKL